jgi:tetratricopeptide (TPR) repeat protein
MVTGRMVVVVALALGPAACRDPAPLPDASAAVAAVPDAGPDAGAPPTPLGPGASWQGRLTGRDARGFVLALAADQAASVVIEGRDVNLRAIVDRDGDGRVFVADLSSGLPDREEIVVVGGDHPLQLTVQAMMPAGEGGDLTVQAEIRPATARDRLLVELEQGLYRLRRDSKRDDAVIVTGDPPVTAVVGLALLERAVGVRELAQRAGDRTREARALAIEADALRQAERFAEAERRWRSVLELARSTDDRSGENAARTQLPWFAHTAGDFAGAARLADEALSACRASRDIVCVGRSLNQRGAAYNELGDNERAADSFREAAGIFGALGDARRRSLMLQNEALAYETGGDEARGRAALAEADAAWQPDPRAAPVEAAFRAMQRAWHALLARDAAAAHQQCAEALALARALERGVMLGDALRCLSEASHIAGEPARALAYAREAIQLAVGGPSDRKESASRLQAGRALHVLGELASARAELEQAAAIARGTRALTDLAYALTELARTRDALGDRSGALSAIDEAVAVVESARARFVGDDLRAAHGTRLRGVYDGQIELLLGGGPAGVEQALIVAEQTRARTLRELMAAARVRSPALADPALAGARDAARAAVRVGEAAHQRLLASSAPPAQVAASWRALARSIDRHQEVEARIRARDPGFARLLAPPRLDVAALRARLAADEVLLAYHLADAASALWVVSPAGVEVVRLPGGPILRAHIRWARALITARAAPGEPGEPAEARAARIRRADATVPAALEAVARVVLGAARDRLPGRRVTIVPDGDVALVPFAALPGLDGAPLLATSELRSVPAAALLLDRPRAARPPRQVAVIADPVVAGGADRAGAAAVAGPLRGAPLARLPWTAVEAERIAAVAPVATVVTGHDATEAAVAGDAIAAADVVHFATHALVDPDAPALSALVLSDVDEAGRPRDGLLRLHEIVELRLAASLVVLSACETALGRDVRGEGMIGLARGFLHAGAGHVVASHWQVHDRGTAELMAGFYAGLLRDRLEPAAALRQAQLALRSEPRWSAPYYWASFAIQGAPPAGAGR